MMTAPLILAEKLHQTNRKPKQATSL